MGQDSTPSGAFAWQVIVVQARGPGRPNVKAPPLQTTITYGDRKESTPLVEESQPLWNFWTQMPDKGGREAMVFSLLERDTRTGITSVEGEARLDLGKYRRVGKSFDLWESLQTKTGEKRTSIRELHLTVTYGINPNSGFEDTDCRLCTYLGMSEGCCIS